MRDAPPLSPSAALRYEVIRSVLDAHRIRSLVEVGPGMGAMAWRIGTDREYHGYEPDGRSFAVAAQRLRGLPNANLYNQPLPVEPTLSVDALVAFEVLEHLEDDASALARWTKWIRPGGLVLLSVPAHQHRFGPWDEAVGHFRRYGKSELAAKLEAAGLVEGEVRAYGMPAGYVLEWVRQRVLARRLGEGRITKKALCALAEPSSQPVRGVGSSNSPWHPVASCRNPSPRPNSGRAG